MLVFKTMYVQTKRRHLIDQNNTKKYFVGCVLLFVFFVRISHLGNCAQLIGVSAGQTRHGKACLFQRFRTVQSCKHGLWARRRSRGDSQVIRRSVITKGGEGWEVYSWISCDVMDILLLTKSPCRGRALGGTRTRAYFVFVTCTIGM